MDEFVNNSNQAAQLSAEQVIAFGEEIVSLTHAGVPIEDNLAAFAKETPGRLGKLTAAVAARMRKGEPLEKIIEDRSLGFPRVFSATISAGAKANRLPAALESTTNCYRRIADLRGEVASAIAYPLVVIAFAWACFALMCRFIIPSLAVSFNDLNLVNSRVFVSLAFFGRYAVVWGIAIPAFFLALVFFIRRWASRLSGAGGAFSRLPGVSTVGSMQNNFKIAAFAENAGLLLENEVPLHEAITLAAQATGDRRLIVAAVKSAEALLQGRQDLLKRNSPFAFSPMLQWMLFADTQAGELHRSLKSAANMFFYRAERQSKVFRALLPAAFMVFAAGGVTLIYALILIMPYAAMLKALAGK